MRVRCRLTLVSEWIECKLRYHKLPAENAVAWQRPSFIYI